MNFLDKVHNCFRIFEYYLRNLPKNDNFIPQLSFNCYPFLGIRKAFQEASANPISVSQLYGVATFQQLNDTAIRMAVVYDCQRSTFDRLKFKS